MSKFILSAILIFTFPGFLRAQPGCTDPQANNFNALATVNDGSCTYNAAGTAPVSSFNLSPQIPETSGLIKWNNYIWTHNDNTDETLYAMDTLNGNVLQSYPLPGVVNIDWEEISQDSSYVYVGDFGNNVNGNRTNLKILRVEKNSILINAPVIDTIFFSYSDQTNFNPAGSNNTDFDCEAFFVSSDSIYLFTKQWVSNKSVMYVLPKTPGTYVAQLQNTLDVNGLVTGAVYLQSQRLIVLCGYSNLVQPFIYLLYDFQGTDFFGGNKRKISVSLPFHQTEGVTTSDGRIYYISNENFVQPPIINVPQKFHIFDLSNFLDGYLDNLTSGIQNPVIVVNSVYPNPVRNELKIEAANYPLEYVISNTIGQTVSAGYLNNSEEVISINELSEGIYIINFNGKNNTSVKIVKQ